MIRKIWIRARGEWPEIPHARLALKNALTEQGFQVSEEHTPDCDLCLCLGGDGALLASVRDSGESRHAISFLGAHSSRGLGFLHPVRLPREINELATWSKALAKMLKEQHYSLEERWGLEISVDGADPLWALNDVVVGKGTLSRLLTLEIKVDGQSFLKRIRGDGLVISSATGSTAYSLSAGGPILDPSLKAMLMTPICPHDVSLRSIVLGPSVTIEVIVSPDSAAAFLTCDGQSGFELQNEQRLTIRKSTESVKWLMPGSAQLRSKNYFETLVSKLGFGRDAL